MGFSKYPNQIDDAGSLPVTTDLVTQVRAEVVNRLRDAIIATESELGTDPSGIFGTVKARFDAIRAEIESIKNELDTTIKGNFSDLTNQLNVLEAKHDADIATVNTVHDADIASLTALHNADIASLTALHNTDIATVNSSITTVIANHDADVATINASLANKLEAPVDANDIDSSQRIIVTLVSMEQVSVDTFTTIGGDIFNPNLIPNPDSSRVITFRARIHTSSGSVAANIRLFNVTDGTAVASTAFSSTQTIPEDFEVVLAVPADLPNSEKSYEVQLKIASPAAVTAFCQKAEIVITWS